MRISIYLWIPQYFEQVEELLCQLLNVLVINNDRQTEMLTANPLVPEPSCFQVEITTEKLQRYQSPDTDQILSELIQVEGNTLCSETHKLIDCI